MGGLLSKRCLKALVKLVVAWQPRRLAAFWFLSTIPPLTLLLPAWLTISIFIHLQYHPLELGSEFPYSSPINLVEACVGKFVRKLLLAARIHYSRYIWPLLPVPFYTGLSRPKKAVWYNEVLVYLFICTARLKISSEALRERLFAGVTLHNSSVLRRMALLCDQVDCRQILLSVMPYRISVNEPSTWDFPIGHGPYSQEGLGKDASS